MLGQQIFNGLTLGMVYALIAVGYSLVFGILRLVYFAHGSVYAFGAYITLVFIAGMGLGVVPAIALSIIATGVLSYFIDYFSLKPLRDKKSKPIASLITTIGISYIIQNMIMIVFGSESKFFPKLWDFGVVEIGNMKLQSAQILIIIVSFVLLAGLTFLIKKTKIGLAMRGTEQNANAAYLMGINVNRVISFTFFLGGASAAVAGALISGYYQIVYPLMGFMAGLKAFSAAVLGGIGILHGAVVGGLIIGVSESITAAYFSGGFRDAVAFILLIAVLIIKPTGLFGKKNITKV